MKSTFWPDVFAIGLFLVGLVLFFVPLIVVPGVVAMLAAVAYWLTMLVLRATKGPRI